MCAPSTVSISNQFIIILIFIIGNFCNAQILTISSIILQLSMVSFYLNFLPQINFFYLNIKKINFYINDTIFHVII